MLLEQKCINVYVYGLDTININPSDLDTLETKYRSVVRAMQCLSPSTPTPAVYLMMAVLPAAAERDIQILRLLGQLAICDRDQQAVSDILESNLGDEDISFAGWSGMARRTTSLYGLPDPLELFQNPWESDRWSQFAKSAVVKYWTTLLQDSAASYTSLDMLDTSRLNLLSPHPIWTAAGSNPVSVMKATVVTWLLTNTYKTGARLHKMRKVKSPECILCLAPVEDQHHFTLRCPALFTIRSGYLNKFIELCPNLVKYITDERVLLLSLLDPFSPIVPADVRESWTDSDKVYQTSRNYFHDIHKKREKLVEKTESLQPMREHDDNTKLIVTLYQFK